MKVAQINITSQGSTGRIMKEIHEITIENNIECRSYHGRGKISNDNNIIKFGTETSFVFHVLATFITNKQGHYAEFQTKKLIKYLEDYAPDIIHLHNIHGYYLNYPMFFRWITNNYTGKVVWTMHDCWAFTGHCTYFVKASCDKWKKQCYKCPQKHAYPFSFFFDTSRREYVLKKELFTSVKSMVVTTPSQWMKKLISQSFLKDTQVDVINNWVDTQAFKPTFDSLVLEHYGISKNKKIILGVANLWEERKGMNVFLELSKIISSDYQIVMVGLNNYQIRRLPSSIIGLKRTNDVKELAIIYSSSYVFLNPSIEESFSLVTLEALACNTPVIVQNTSAVHEMVNEAAGYIAIDFKIETYVELINRIESVNRRNEVIRKSVLHYNKKEKISQFLQLYRGMED